MDPDPMQFVEEDGEKKETETIREVKKSKAHLKYNGGDFGGLAGDSYGDL